MALAVSAMITARSACRLIVVITAAALVAPVANTQTQRERRRLLSPRIAVSAKTQPQWQIQKRAADEDLQRPASLSQEWSSTLKGVQSNLTGATDGRHGALPAALTFPSRDDECGSKSVESAGDVKTPHREGGRESCGCCDASLDKGTAPAEPSLDFKAGLI
ncbi:unnamed protein product [Lampetra planeri]